MSAVNERNISRFLFNYFAVYMADVGDDQPSTPSFYSEQAVGFTFGKEFVEAMAFKECSGINYTVRQDMSRYDFRASFSIKETTLETIKIAHAGTINSDNDEIYLDGANQNYAVWFESCFNDDSKIVRIKIPKAKMVDSQEVATGDSHVIHPVSAVALVDPVDQASFPSIYIEP